MQHMLASRDGRHSATIEPAEHGKTLPGRLHQVQASIKP
jgi:hypothetical protein